jgi:hypothetical protein
MIRVPIQACFACKACAIFATNLSTRATPTLKCAIKTSELVRRFNALLGPIAKQATAIPMVCVLTAMRTVTVSVLMKSATRVNTYKNMECAKLKRHQIKSTLSMLFASLFQST